MHPSEGATLNYLGEDRIDFPYAVEEICPGMSKPAEGCKAGIKRIVWYLVGAKRLL